VDVQVINFLLWFSIRCYKSHVRFLSLLFFRQPRNAFICLQETLSLIWT